MTALYSYLIKLQLLQSLAYRFEFVSSIVSNLFFLFGSVYLWKSAYQGLESVAGVTEEQMITYAIVSVLMGAVFQVTVDGNLFSKVRQGDIALDFIRPVRLLLFWFVEDIGRSIAAVARFCLPVLAFAILFVLPPAPASWKAALLFLPCCCFSYLLLWQMGALIGLTSFWVIELGNISSIKNVLILVLSGRLIPLWLFPESVQRLSSLLPFQYTYQTPLEIYIGTIGPGEVLPILMTQAAWCLGLAAILTVVWQRAQRRVFVQGG